MQKTDEKILIEAGLSEEQAITYQALLERGPQKASNIAKWTGIDRSLTYKILEQLEAMGLVSKKGGAGTVNTFSANHPNLLLDKLEADKKRLDLATETVRFGLNGFISQFNLLSGKPNVQFYEGREGVKKVLEDSLQTKDTVLSLIDTESLLTHFADINADYAAKREKLGINKKVLIPESEIAKNYMDKNPKTKSYTRILKKAITPFAAEMQIYDNKISYITIGKNTDQLIGVIIEDQQIAEMHRYFFECLYDYAG